MTATCNTGQQSIIGWYCEGTFPALFTDSVTVAKRWMELGSKVVAVVRQADVPVPAPAAGDALDGLVDRLAGMAYSFAVRLDQATRGANGDELEGVARRVTADLKAEIRAAIAQQSQRKEA